LVGRPAPWFLLIRLARSLGVPPWELLEHPEWLEWSIQALAIEAEAAETKARWERWRSQLRS
jgi:hypothetical protein